MSTPVSGFSTGRLRCDLQSIGRLLRQELPPLKWTAGLGGREVWPNSIWLVGCVILVIVCVVVDRGVLLPTRHRFPLPSSIPPLSGRLLSSFQFDSWRAGQGTTDSLFSPWCWCALKSRVKQGRLGTPRTDFDGLAGDGPPKQLCLAHAAVFITPPRPQPRPMIRTAPPKLASEWACTAGHRLVVHCRSGASRLVDTRLLASTRDQH